MAGRFGEMTWQEELDLLTRFHENNHLEDTSSRPLANDAPPLLPPGSGGRVRSLGSGRKKATQDDSFNTKQIVEHLGTGHRSESVFSGKSVAESSTENTSPLSASTAAQKETVHTKTTLKSIRKKDTSSEGKQENKDTDSNYLGRGRGRKARDGSAELQVGAVANLIERNLGLGHRLEISATGNSSSVARGLYHPNYDNININSNSNPSYFQKFDYTQMNIGTAREWWRSSQDAASESIYKSKNQEKEKQVVVKNERAVLSIWTPLDDSV